MKSNYLRLVSMISCAGLLIIASSWPAAKARVEQTAIPAARACATVRR